ncbi:hypothetical protein LOZ53_003162 [Ophidiomyces ophidiicola]|uniref:uncharacterized protein n=1 Tax=Ophidiomyces ophidiicola TaxID=1387563 RepID=UPI0020C3D3E0|nr:uncharacterized protein LOZ57_001078 [Ophidiomyces ophidiicola]KAI1951667.1 hypothetical protein LOZ57_001078 [Ophidiomyces ophidiicola]KAI1976547.1 hypothetical protein LOZ55_004226 [Ophidiomyces ophidiicola]KAI1990701.1 hypothetical protein LOZ53_003162 [Ophidiomyces ophidiicola]KAI1991296.1 hypothetical protein LOZ54_002173 [Ophidiomyces ophidiicola]KAI1999289.1 hypothetical protein LOZ51_001776 [Ophidiomyces ophidiicola]
MPLFDAYVASARPQELHNPLLNPILADILDLPPKMLFIIPTLDILVQEQTVMVNRLKREAEQLNSRPTEQVDTGIASGVKSAPECHPRERLMTNFGLRPPRYHVESILFENQLHGWLELPSMAIDEQTRISAFDAGIRFITDVHREHGWHLATSI